MSTVDQARAYLALKSEIAAVRQEFGEDTAWHIVEMAVVANLCEIFNTTQSKKEPDHA